MKMFNWTKRLLHPVRSFREDQDGAGPAEARRHRLEGQRDGRPERVARRPAEAPSEGVVGPAGAVIGVRGMVRKGMDGRTDDVVARGVASEGSFAGGGGELRFQR